MATIAQRRRKHLLADSHIGLQHPVASEPRHVDRHVGTRLWPPTSGRTQ